MIILLLLYCCHHHYYYFIFKVLGLGHILGKCRLYTKHPKLFKYCGDQQDQDWLAAQKIGPMPVSTNKVYFMLLEEIKELACSDEYR